MGENEDPNEYFNIIKKWCIGVVLCLK
jgi:hypothetical protein